MNSQCPYLEVYQVDGAVEHRNEFINCFLSHEDFYYSITDSDTSTWTYQCKTLRNPVRQNKKKRVKTSQKRNAFRFVKIAHFNAFITRFQFQLVEYRL